MSMSFSNIPRDIRAPLFYVEVDNSQANSGSSTQRALIIGPMSDTGTGEANTPLICQGVAHGKTVGGVGSVLALMVEAYRRADDFGELWMLPLTDDETAIQAKGSVAFQSAATQTGVLYLYVAGVRVSVTVTATLTLPELASALMGRINANSDLPVVATIAVASPSTVVLTAKNAGLVGNEIDLRLNYRGVVDGEVLPSGLGVTVTPMATGAVNPGLTAGLANLLDKEFDFIALPFTDTASLDAIKAFLNTKNGRWSWDKQIYGHAFAAHRGTLGGLSTFGNSRNDEHTSVMGFYDSPSPAWIWAVDLAATAAVSVRADPARPLQTLALSSVLPPPLVSRFELTDRNVLLWDGISTFTVASDGTVAIENLITTYQENSFGQPDDSFLQVETLFTLAFVLRQMRAVITSKFARVKLGDAGDNYDAGTNVVTTTTIRGELLAQYQTLVTGGFCQKYEVFAANLIVEKNASNPNRVDVLWPAVLINQLRIFALLAQFRLQ